MPTLDIVDAFAELVVCVMFHLPYRSVQHGSSDNVLSGVTSSWGNAFVRHHGSAGQEDMFLGSPWSPMTELREAATSALTSRPSSVASSSGYCASLMTAVQSLPEGSAMQLHRRTSRAAGWPAIDLGSLSPHISSAADTGSFVQLTEEDFLVAESGSSMVCPCTPPSVVSSSTFGIISPQQVSRHMSLRSPCGNAWAAAHVHLCDEEEGAVPQGGYINTPCEREALRSQISRLSSSSEFVTS